MALIKEGLWDETDCRRSPCNNCIVNGPGSCGRFWLTSFNERHACSEIGRRRVSTRLSVPVKEDHRVVYKFARDYNVLVTDVPLDVPQW